MAKIPSDPLTKLGQSAALFQELTINAQRAAKQAFKDELSSIMFDRDNALQGVWTMAVGGRKSLKEPTAIDMWVQRQKAQLVDYFQDEYGLELNMLSYGVSILFSSFANAKKVKKRMPMALTDVIADVTKAPVPTHKKYLVLEAMLQDEDFEEVELPYVRLKLF